MGKGNIIAVSLPIYPLFGALLPSTFFCPLLSLLLQCYSFFSSRFLALPCSVSRVVILSFIFCNTFASHRRRFDLSRSLSPGVEPFQFFSDFIILSLHSCCLFGTSVDCSLLISLIFVSHLSLPYDNICL